MTVISAIVIAVSTIMSKTRLQQIPLGIFSVFRNIIATILFFIFAVYLYGFEHFIDIASPFLWQWMLVYSGLIVVFGQLCWFSALKTSSAVKISLANSFTPIAGILFAYLVLGEIPTAAQYIGGAIIILGIFLSQVGNLRKSHVETSNTEKISAEEMSNEVGFKGI